MMKIKILYLKILLLSINLVFSQSPPKSIEPFKAGEAREYRVHYGIFNASYASLKLSSEELNGEKLLLASGYGKTIGLARLFFKRNIYEGGYTKNLEVQFDSESNEAIVNNIKNGTIKTISTEKNIQDLISSLYYLRKNFSPNSIGIGNYFTINMFYDSKNRELSLKYLGKEVINTKYGKVECLKLMPATNRSRIFKGEGSITIWLTNDKNRLPIRVQADLLVGSIKADLEKFSGIANPIEIQINN